MIKASKREWPTTSGEWTLSELVRRSKMGGEHTHKLTSPKRRSHSLRPHQTTTCSPIYLCKFSPFPITSTHLLKLISECWLKWMFAESSTIALRVCSIAFKCRHCCANRMTNWFEIRRTTLIYECIMTTVQHATGSSSSINKPLDCAKMINEWGVILKSVPVFLSVINCNASFIYFKHKITITD